MSATLPLFRAEISVDVHHENEESFLILSDPFGFADGPIMLHPDMVEILELCDGKTTWDELLARAGKDATPETLLPARAFIAQLDQMGFFETDQAALRRKTVLDEWAQLEVRQPVCAGQTYPADEAELRPFLDALCMRTTEPPDQAEQPSSMIFMPHIDFRVAGEVYAHAVHALKQSMQHGKRTLVVMIGTSHYWHGDPVIGLSKHMQTPLGTLPTDLVLVQRFREALDGRGLPSWTTDVAHKPEHSLELHALLFQYACPDCDVEVLPLLIAGTQATPERDEFQLYAQIADTLRTVVEQDGRPVVWLVSGDLSHTGTRFGHPVPAADLRQQTFEHDEAVFQALVTASPEEVDKTIRAVNNRFNVCGHLPAVVGLGAAKCQPGNILAYDEWDDAPTHSAVTFAVVRYPAGSAP